MGSLDRIITYILDGFSIFIIDCMNLPNACKAFSQYVALFFWQELFKNIYFVVGMRGWILCSVNACWIHFIPVSCKRTLGHYSWRVLVETCLNSTTAFNLFSDGQQFGRIQIGWIVTRENRERREPIPWTIVNKTDLTLVCQILSIRIDIKDSILHCHICQ